MTRRKRAWQLVDEIAIISGSGVKKFLEDWEYAYYEGSNRIKENGEGKEGEYLVVGSYYSLEYKYKYSDRQAAIKKLIEITPKAEDQFIIKELLEKLSTKDTSSGGSSPLRAEIKDIPKMLNKFVQDFLKKKERGVGVSLVLRHRGMTTTEEFILQEGNIEEWQEKINSMLEEIGVTKRIADSWYISAKEPTKMVISETEEDVLKKPFTTFLIAISFQLELAKRPPTAEEKKERIIEISKKLSEKYQLYAIGETGIQVFISNPDDEYHRKMAFNSLSSDNIERPPEKNKEILKEALDLYNNWLARSSSPFAKTDPVFHGPTTTTDVGGIDFTRFNTLYQPMGSFLNRNYSLPNLSSSALERIDLDKELVSFRQMASSGILPNGQRFKEYLAACFQKGRFPQLQDELLVCLAEIFLLAEDKNLNLNETQPQWQEALVITDTGKFVLLPNNQKAGLN